MINTESKEGGNGLKDVTIDGEPFFKIENSHRMRPFLMSIVSDSDHWMFISSNGGLTAGRRNAEFALFPYYTDDKLTESAEITGSKTIFQVTRNGRTEIWEPFSYRYEGKYTITRNLYKNTFGNKVIFEEINNDLMLTFRYQWNSSEKYGFVKKSTLTNDARESVDVAFIDGLQNILPYGVGSDLQNGTSNLVNAYKRNELDVATGIGIFALSAIIVDKAEPSEALKANIAWSLGLNDVKYLLSSVQLNAFRNKEAIHQEEDVKAEKGAYLIASEIHLEGNEDREWMIIGDVNLKHSAIAELAKSIQSDLNLREKVNADIESGQDSLKKLNAASDGIQFTADPLNDARHFSNTLFNIMRGGIFDDNYIIEKWDFQNYLKKANSLIAKEFEELLDEMPDRFTIFDLREKAENTNDQSFYRLTLEYMPLKFSRRHGDPSRPWNKFSINTRNEIDGSKVLDYEGNWRDIFQNWEALVHSYPEYIDSMITKFLNASTFDGYNPYRVTKDGFDWEAIEPDDPWSYIGYWGDHQIIYLLKFLEFAENYFPGKLQEFFNEDIFVYANVPYTIKDYSKILEDAKDTIDFNHELDLEIRKRRSEQGADGALLVDRQNDVVQVSFIEKILATTLAKISNFIPEGGIWMNTQRPEWNDANNALVGNGVSMVTLNYLHRFFKFFSDLLNSSRETEFHLSSELAEYFENTFNALKNNKAFLENGFNDVQRKQVLDQLGMAASEYRNQIYEHAFSGSKVKISVLALKEFSQLSLNYLEQTIEVNKRPDNLFHAYNLMTVSGDKVIISHLDEMLEGQVAVLSSRFLSTDTIVNVLDTMRNSKLYREDQNSYLLYPNKDLKGFLQRNTIPENLVLKSSLLKRLIADENLAIIEKDINMKYHFNGNFTNAKGLAIALDELAKQEVYSTLVAEERQLVLAIYEEVFNHKAFTGRSGTFFGYEGLGSIYWHMVSKYLLAVQECYLEAVENGENKEKCNKILNHYYEINAGIGVHKSPENYGAFPTDPYSHTPMGKGAQQPGMTGQVKEDIISRFGELGVFVKGGRIHYKPSLLRSKEFMREEGVFRYINLKGEEEVIQVASNSLCFTCCQVPIIYTVSEVEGISLNMKDGKTLEIDTPILDEDLSRSIFQRTGEVLKVNVQVPRNILHEM